MTQSLTKFFREKKQRADAQSAGVDWGRRRREWLAAIETLYATIGRFLAQPIKQGSVTLHRVPMTISEPHLGKYQTEELVLTVADEQVHFVPKACIVAGARGRVDVRGESGDSMLLRQAGKRWAIVTSRYPELRLAELNAHNFAELLKAAMRL